MFSILNSKFITVNLEVKKIKPMLNLLLNKYIIDTSASLA